MQVPLEDRSRQALHDFVQSYSSDLDGFERLALAKSAADNYAIVAASRYNDAHSRYLYGLMLDRLPVLGQPFSDIDELMDHFDSTILQMATAHELTEAPCEHTRYVDTWIENSTAQERMTFQIHYRSGFSIAQIHEQKAEVYLAHDYLQDGARELIHAYHTLSQFAVEHPYCPADVAIQAQQLLEVLQKHDIIQRLFDPQKIEGLESGNFLGTPGSHQIH